jgi:NhaP-type Na+/H+ or K+/H+ antiporter
MRAVAVQVTLAVLGCVLYAFTSLILHHYKITHGGNAPVHETTVVMLFGMLVGGAMKYQGIYVEFDPEIFFYLVLPPIIFSAGFGLKRKRILTYLPEILLFGIVGTLTMFLVMALCASFLAMLFNIHITWIQCLLLSSVLSATDDVSTLSLIKISEYPR